MSRPASIADFAGRWHLSRRIDDQLSGQVITGEGAAVVSSVQSSYCYDEELTLQTAGQRPMAAHRRYVWRPSGCGVTIWFEDGRFFHDLKLSETHPKAHHDCAPDIYDVAYDFSAWPIWSVTWTVVGPRKNYVMHTAYRR
ncbi:MAG: DUF6314 family protein [Pseudomonadota bacterium]